MTTTPDGVIGDALQKLLNTFGTQAGSGPQATLTDAIITSPALLTQYNGLADSGVLIAIASASKPGAGYAQGNGSGGETIYLGQAMVSQDLNDLIGLHGNLITLESTYTTTSGQTGYIVQASFPYGGPDVTVPANASTGSTFTDYTTGAQVVLGDGGSDRLSTSGSNVLLDGNGGNHNDLYGGSGDGTLITWGSYDLLQGVSGNDLLEDNGEESIAFIAAMAA